MFFENFQDTKISKLIFQKNLKSQISNLNKVEKIFFEISEEKSSLQNILKTHSIRPNSTQLDST